MADYSCKEFNVKKNIKGRYNIMRKIREEYFEIADNEDGIKWISCFMDVYPTNKGYRIETFSSPNLLKIIVYETSLQERIKQL